MTPPAPFPAGPGPVEEQQEAATVSGDKWRPVGGGILSAAGVVLCFGGSPIAIGLLILVAGFVLGVLG